MKGLAVVAILLIAGALALNAHCLVQCAAAPPCHQHMPGPGECEHSLAPQAVPGVQVEWQFVAPAEVWEPRDIVPLPQPSPDEAPPPAFASSRNFTILRI